MEASVEAVGTSSCVSSAEVSVEASNSMEAVQGFVEAVEAPVEAVETPTLFPQRTFPWEYQWKLPRKLPRSGVYFYEHPRTSTNFREPPLTSATSHALQLDLNGSFHGDVGSFAGSCPDFYESLRSFRGSCGRILGRGFDGSFRGSRIYFHGRIFHHGSAEDRVGRSYLGKNFRNFHGSFGYFHGSLPYFHGSFRCFNGSFHYFHGRFPCASVGVVESSVEV